MDLWVRIPSRLTAVERNMHSSADLTANSDHSACRLLKTSNLPATPSRQMPMDRGNSRSSPIYPVSLDRWGLEHRQAAQDPPILAVSVTSNCQRRSRP